MLPQYIQNYKQILLCQTADLNIILQVILLYNIYIYCIYNYHRYKTDIIKENYAIY